MGAVIAKHSSAGRMAMLGAVLTYGCLSQFPPLITQAHFHEEPSAWTLDMIGYAREYEFAIEAAHDIFAHLQLMCWDTVFAWIKGLTVYSMLCVLTPTSTTTATTEYNNTSTSSSSSSSNRRSTTATTTPVITPLPWFAYTIPVHVALDTLENIVTMLAIALHQYYQDEHNTKLVPSETIKTLLMLLPCVTMLKWCCAAINTGSVPILTVYRLLQWCHKTILTTVERKRNKNK